MPSASSELWTAPLGQHPLVLWLRRRDAAAQTERQLARISLETGRALPTSPSAKLPGDPAALRGLPMVGRGIGGTMAETQPERETLARERRRLKVAERTSDSYPERG